MANQLGMAMRHSILVLRDRGWSHRRIARELGIHRETVSRYLGLSQGEPAPAHPPPEPGSKPAISITGSAGRGSLCAPYVEVILGKLEEGLSAQRIWQDLASDHGFADGYQPCKK